MKILVVYSSKTGNTRKIARAIADALPAADLAAVEDRPDASAYDIVFMGFWVDKRLSRRRRTGLHDNHRRGNTSPCSPRWERYPDSQHAVDSLDNAAKLLPDAVLIDRFICQGAIDPKLIDWMKQLPPEHPHAPDEATRSALARRRRTSRRNRLPVRGRLGGRPDCPRLPASLTGSYRHAFCSH